MRIWHLGAAVLIAAVGFGLARWLGALTAAGLVPYSLLMAWVWAMIVRSASAQFGLALARRRGRAMAVSWLALCFTLTGLVIICVSLLGGALLIYLTSPGLREET